MGRQRFSACVRPESRLSVSFCVITDQLLIAELSAPTNRSVRPGAVSVIFQRWAALNALKSRGYPVCEHSLCVSGLRTLEIMSERDFRRIVFGIRPRNARVLRSRSALRFRSRSSVRRSRPAKPFLPLKAATFEGAGMAKGRESCETPCEAFVR